MADVVTAPRSEPASGRYLKVVNRGTVADKWWSVHAFAVDFDPGFPDTPIASASLAGLSGDDGFITAWDMSNVFTRDEDDGALFSLPHDFVEQRGSGPDFSRHL